MRNDTPLTIVGRLTDDPKLTFTPNGTARAVFTVAFNPRRYDKQAGEWIDGDPSFYECLAWRQLAENIAESIAKGDRVVVTGRFSQRHWTDSQTNQKRSAWGLEVDDIGASMVSATVTVKRKSARSNGRTSADDPWHSEDPGAAAPTAQNGTQDQQAGPQTDTPPETGPTFAQHVHQSAQAAREQSAGS